LNESKASGSLLSGVKPIGLAIEEARSLLLLLVLVIFAESLVGTNSGRVPTFSFLVSS